MSTPDDDPTLAVDLDFNVDADAYATAAAPSHDRRALTAAQYDATRATYAAKHDHGDIHAGLDAALPQLGRGARLGPKDVQLVAAAAGELYFLGRYGAVRALVGRVRAGYDVAGSAGFKGRGLGVVLAEWEARCVARMGDGGKDRGTAEGDGEEG